MKTIKTKTKKKYRLRTKPKNYNPELYVKSYYNLETSTKTKYIVWGQNTPKKFNE